MSTTPPSRTRKALALSYVEGSFYAVMVGTAETFALFFAVKRGVTTGQLALLSTLPILLGALLQWLVPGRVPFAAIRKVMAFCLCAQVAGMAGFIVAFRSADATFFPVLLASLGLYWGAGLICGPLWMDWISPWLPHRCFGLFIARRNGVISLVTLLAYVGAAWLIHGGGRADALELVFGVGITARLLSILTMVNSPSPAAPVFYRESVANPPRLRDTKPVLWMIGCCVLFKFVVNLSSPFFLPYMLNVLKLDLLDYVLLTAAPFVGRYLYTARWGEAARTMRPFVGLQIAMVLIAVSPALWTYTTRVGHLAAIELLSGAMWGGFDLCAVLVIQNFWPGSARRVLGIYLSFSHAAALIGASCGARLLDTGWLHHNLFILSADLRLAVACLFAAVFGWAANSRRPLKVYGDFLSTVLSIRPSLANVGRIIPLRRRGVAAEAGEKSSPALRG